MSKRTHLPAIIFALRIIIASPSKGVSVMALGVGALTISALQALSLSRCAVWAFNKSSNLCVRKPPRPRADAVTATASRRWRRTPNVIPHGLALDALVLREHVFGHLVLVLVLLRLLALGLLGLFRDLRLRLGESEFGASWAQRIRWSMILKCYCGRP